MADMGSQLKRSPTERANYFRQLRRREGYVGQWYYAGLCVECRVCGAGIGERCVRQDGGLFHEGSHKHHYWRYRDVRTLIGKQLPGGDYTDRETWEAKRSERVYRYPDEPVNTSPNAA